MRWMFGLDDLDVFNVLYVLDDLNDLDVLDILDLLDLVFVFVFVFIFVILVRRSYLISLHHQLFKNISHHGYFQGFTAQELCGANKWMGWDGMCGAII